MKPLTILRRLILVTAVLTLLSLFSRAAHAQQDQTITGSLDFGSFEPVSSFPAAKLSLSLPPNGGPVVAGTLGTQGNGFQDCTIGYGITLKGTFAGGDGGEASGTIDGTGHVVQGAADCQPEEGIWEDMHGTWTGKFYANGKGNGKAILTGATTYEFTWEATYDAQEFQAALTAPPAVIATQPPIATEEPYSTEPALATEEILPVAPILATEEPYEQPTAQPVDEAAPSTGDTSNIFSTFTGLGLLGAGGVAGIGGLGLLANTLLRGGSSSAANAAGFAPAAVTEAADTPIDKWESSIKNADTPAPPVEDPAAQLDTYPVPSDSHLQIGRNIAKNLPPRILGMLTRGAWKKLDDKERQQVIKYVVWQMGKQMGIGKIKPLWEMPKGPGYTDSQEAKNYAGQAFFNKVPPEIFINTKNPSTWDIPEQLLDTLGHEIRHMQQYLPGHSLENDQLNQLATYNKEHYRKYDANKPDASQDQFVERDAQSMGRNAGTQISKKAYQQKLDELGEFYKSTMERTAPREVPRSQLDDLLANKPDSYRKRVGELITEGKLKVLDY